MIGYYIDAKGRLIYEAHGMKSEIIGVEENNINGIEYIFFMIDLLWEK
jgi:hypothetical protein